mmetsp:Transcript_84954/g.160086  ORF Transcript_84954/g.160086 Transcript_84954/m.160086 type:complete len:970 (-) Transcript_84954:69-2978(-)
MLLRKRSEGLLERSPLLQLQSNFVAGGISGGSGVREHSRSGAPALDLRQHNADQRSSVAAAAAELSAGPPSSFSRGAGGGPLLYAAGRRRRNGTPLAAGSLTLGPPASAQATATRGDERDGSGDCERDGALTDGQGADTAAERRASTGRANGDRRAATPVLASNTATCTPTPPVAASADASPEPRCTGEDLQQQQSGGLEQGLIGSGYGLAARSQATSKLSICRGRPGKETLERLPAAPGAAERPTDIVIHVCDEARGLRRDFKCNLDLLLTHMKYFESYLTGVTSSDDVDILVHCDVGVFEWLAEYMVDPTKADLLDVNIVVSILISSNFLQMDRLVDTCLSFIRGSINQVLRLPIDLGCLSNELVRRLARLFMDEDLDVIRDKRDRLSSRLYAHKLEELLADEDNMLHRCAYCHGLFTAKQRECTVCPKADIFIDFHGNVIAQHVADADWDMSSYVQYCREVIRLQWREIYWKMWARVHTFRCSVCHQHFCGAELGHCSYHPEKPVWNSPPRSHTGVYPCCQQPALRFGDSIPRTGCCASDHVVDLGSDATANPIASVFDKLLRHKAIACVNFEDRDKDLYPEAGSGTGAAAFPGEDEEEDEDSEGEEDGLGASRDAAGGGGPAFPCNDGQSTAHYTDAGSGRASWYCFDPLPEQRCLLSEFSGQGRLGHERRSRRVVAGARGSGGGGVGRSQDITSTRPRTPNPTRREKRGEAGGRHAEGRSRGATSTAQGAKNPPAAGPTAGRRGGGGAGRRCSGWMGSSWPGPASDGASTFFSHDCPPSVSGRRALDYKMDMLREDDRRRMDELGERIQSCRQESARREAASRVDTAALRMQSLAWLGDAAAANAASAAPIGASPARRRGKSAGRTEPSGGVTRTPEARAAEASAARSEGRQQSADRERAASRGRTPASVSRQASGPSPGSTHHPTGEAANGTRPTSAPGSPPPPVASSLAGNRHSLGAGVRRG